MPLSLNCGTGTSFCDIVNDHSVLIDASLVDAQILSNGVLTLTSSDGSTFNNTIPYFPDWVISGINLSLQAIPNSNLLDYTSGTYQINGIVYTLAAAGTLVITNGDPLFNRYDIVVLDNTSTISIINGTASASPVAPATPAGMLKIADLFVQANATAATGGFFILPYVFFGSNTTTNILPGISNQTLYWETANNSWTPNSSLISDGSTIAVNTTISGESVHIGGRIELDDSSAPGITTNKLYAIAGDLYWDGQVINSNIVAPGIIVGSFLIWDGSAWTEETNLNYSTVTSEFFIEESIFSMSSTILNPNLTFDLRYDASFPSFYTKIDNWFGTLPPVEHSMEISDGANTKFTKLLLSSMPTAINQAEQKCQIAAEMAGTYFSNLEVGVNNTAALVNNGLIYDIITPAGSAQLQILSDSPSGGLFSFFVSDGIDTTSVQYTATDITLTTPNDFEANILNTFKINSALTYLNCGLRQKITNYSAGASYNMLQNDLIILVTTTAARNVNLLTLNPLFEGNTVTIKDKTGNAATNNITITPTGGALIDGATSYTINVNYASITLVADGTNWFII